MTSLFQPIHQFSFAGQRAATANHTRLSQAQERAARGDDAETIRRETGWHTGADGQWRFEIDDHAAGFNTTLLSNLRGGGFSDRRIESVSYRRDEDSTYQLCLTSVAPKKVSDFVTIRAIPEAMVKALISPEAWQAIERGDGEEDLIGANLDDAKRVQVAFDFTGFNALPLDAVMDHPALFAAYPALRGIMVAVDPKLTNGASLEIWDYVDGTSGMVIRIGNPALRNVERAILHEIQHAVQNLEGFAPGGAPSQFKTIHSDEVAAILRRELRAAQRAKGYLSWFEQMPDVPTAAQQKAIDKVQAARRAVKQFDDTGEDPRVLTATQQYFQLAGEVEARNVEHRRVLNAEERQQTPPEATEDVPRAKQAVTSNGTSLMLSFAGEQAQTADLPSLAAAQARIEAGKAARAQIHNLDKVAVEEVADGGALKFRVTQAGAYLGRFGTFDEAQAFIAGERDRMRTLLEQVNKDSAEAIRQDTGWHPGPDGKWRFEISDNEARFAENVYVAERDKWYPSRFIADARSHDNEDGATGSLGVVLSHPALFAAYPSLSDMPINAKIRRGPERGTFDGARVFAQAESPERLLSVILHEIQHGIQQIEQFARGGDLIGDRTAYAKQLGGELSRLLAADPVLGAAYDAWNTAQRAMEKTVASAMEFDDAIATVQRLEDALRALPHGRRAHGLYFSLAGLRSDWSADNVMRDRYQRLAGEVEARNTQARQALTAQERQQTPPGATADVPSGKLIVEKDAAAQPDQTKTDAFEVWFGDSKVVDAEGKPLVVYHGTASEFSTFSRARSGFFFTDSRDVAQAYADHDEKGDGAPRVIASYLAIKNPQVLTREWYYANVLEENGDKNWEAVDMAVADADESGHDGLILRGFPDFSGMEDNPGGAPRRLEHEYDQYIAFRPEQIKSATDNNGDFDANNPDIRFSLAAPPASAAQAQPDAFKQWFGNDSTLVSPGGSPMVLYHGTGSKFTQFRRSQTGAMGPGVYLGNAREVAQAYDGNGKGEHVVMAVYARGKYLSNRQWSEYIGKHGWSGAEAAATADGWSGVHDQMFESAVCVWDPMQIKSATDNNGDFDANNPDIRFSLAAPPASAAQAQQDAFKEWFRSSKVVDSRGEPLVMYHGTTETTYVPATTQAGSASARAELERMALVHGIKEWSDVPSVMERWIELGQAERFGVTAQVAEHARELQRQARVTITVPSRVELGFWAFDMPGAGKELGAHFGTRVQALARGTPFSFYLQIEHPLRLPDLGTWDYQSVMREARKRGVPISEEEYDRVFNAFNSNAALRTMLQAKGYDGVVYENEAEGKGDSWIAFRPEQIKSATDNNGDFDGDNPDIRFSEAAVHEHDFDAKLTQGTSEKVVDFSQDERFHDLFYRDPTPERLSEFQAWLDANPDTLVKMFHGTSALNPVGEQGLLKTTARRRNSLQSSSGYVYLSVYPGMADSFAKMAALNRGANVYGKKHIRYSTQMRVSELLADKDQLRNQRLFGERTMGSSLAESLVYGHAARVKGDIAPERIREEVMFSHGPQFFSQLQRAIEEAPTKMAALPADQWSAWLLSNASRLGIKKDELEWSGILGFLAARGKEKATRSDLAAYLQEGGVRIGETILGGVKRPESLAPEYADDSATWLVVNEEGAIMADDFQTRNDAVDWINKNRNTLRAGPKYGTYVAPGGENYREVLITLPRSEITTGDVAHRLFGMSMADLSNAQRDQVVTEMRRIGDSTQRDYKSPHFDEPNILVHMRVDDRVAANGKKTLMIHEIQSDWGQEGKKNGIKSGYKPVLPEIHAKSMTGRDFVAERAMPAAAAQFWLQGRNDIRSDLGKPPVSLDDYFTIIYENSIPKIVKDGALDPIAVADAHRARYEAMLATGRRHHASSQSGRVPDAPFIGDTKAWVALAIKRAVMLAVQDGYDSVSVITGEQAARLYDLSKQVESLSVKANLDGTYDIDVALEESTKSYHNQTPQQVEATIGKEIAKMGIEAADAWLAASKAYRDALRIDGIAESELNALRLARDEIQCEFSGESLKVGGEGLATFYDEIVPQVARDVLKKLGGSLTHIHFGPQADGEFGVFSDDSGEILFSSDSERDAREYCRVYPGQAHVRPVGLTGALQGFDITPAMRLKVLAGIPQFSHAPLDGAERDERMETLQDSPRRDKASIASVQAAISTLVNDKGVLGQRLGSIVACSARDLQEKWISVLGSSPQASEQARRAQGFYAAASSTIFLITDNIAAGDELGVVAHELMHKHGKAILGADGWAQLHGAIEGWSRASPGSQERAIYAEAVRRVTASKRADADSAVHSSQELFPYAVEVALRMGVQPSWEAPKDSAAGWLARVRSTLCSVWEKVTSKPKEMTASDLVTLAYGIAHRERVEHEVDGVRDADSPLSSASFKAWFSGSKAVDAAGAPLVLYHGTKAEFNSFDYAKIGKNGRAEGAGFYFTDNISVASRYGKLMPVYLALRKPLAYDAKAFGRTLTEKLVRRIAVLQTEMCGISMANSFLADYADVDHEGLGAAIREATKSLLDSATAVDQLSDLASSGVPVALVNQACFDVTGHDGIVSNGFSNCGDDDTNIFVAFFPEQIKSASGNCGQYDGNTPNIYHSLPLQAAPATNHEQPPDYDSVETDEQSWERPRSR